MRVCATPILEELFLLLLAQRLYLLYLITSFWLFGREFVNNSSINNFEGNSIEQQWRSGFLFARNTLRMRLPSLRYALFSAFLLHPAIHDLRDRTGCLTANAVTTPVLSGGTARTRGTALFPRSKQCSRRFSTHKPAFFIHKIPRGGTLPPVNPSLDSKSEDSSVSGNVTVEGYVAAMEEMDAQEQKQVKDDNDSADSDGTETNDSNAYNDDKEDSSEMQGGDSDTSVVGLKKHHKHKKSNAVGDPDGENSDSDDESDIDSEEWQEIEAELEELDAASSAEQQEVHVDVEVVAETESDAREEPKNNKKSFGSGGVGIRLGQRLGRRRNRNVSNNENETGAKNRRSAASAAKTEVDQEQLLEVWAPHVYMPPPKPAMEYLGKNSRMIDGSSKIRLDRRTFYAGLLLEWTNASSTSYRKYLETPTSQALQAALSLATQPEWRKSFPRPSGIRLYDNENPLSGCTLAMQETIALALAHSLGTGMVILDDTILSTVREQLLKNGYSEEMVKPAALIKSLLALARQGHLRQITDNGASIDKCMLRDLELGLDDRFDERVTSSTQEMSEWEKKWQKPKSKSKKSPGLPLVVFLRVQSSQMILKSKSAVEVLLQECTSDDGTNLVVLGKGIDANTVSLPQEVAQDSETMEQQELQPQSMQEGGPWFGFSPNNQNASGQNDPEGSRRFNIFLARTRNNDGTPGIIGAIAPPQAGNLFPHMMAMQARERLRPLEDGEDNPFKAPLDRITEMMQQQMDNDGPSPQFFNASMHMSPSPDEEEDQEMPPDAQLPNAAMLQQAMVELLDRLAQNGDGDESDSFELSPDLDKAFAQVLRNENLRRGIAKNLSRAAPALADENCRGIMLSVYVPPPPHHANRGKLPGLPQPEKSPPMGGWFQKILNSQSEGSTSEDEDHRKKSVHNRIRTMAAAAAVMAADNANESKKNGGGGQQENKADRNLAKLESLFRPIVMQVPSDPVRAKSFKAWISRERGAVIFRQNRLVLNARLLERDLSLQEHTGTRGAGSALRQMLSVRDISDEMEDVIKCAIELEANKCQRMNESPSEAHEKEQALATDITLSQLLLTDNGLVETNEEVVEVTAATKTKRTEKPGIQYLHPSSLEAALSLVCQVSVSASGGLTVSSSRAAQRSKEEIQALAQDKHERALISQVASPQDIGVTYDMIGGLTNVKELLRQSITYPLKFPHLYSEGIAREAVKGVLLFGPPGKMI